MSAMKRLLEDMYYDFEDGKSVKEIAVKYGLPYKTVFMTLLEMQDTYGEEEG